MEEYTENLNINSVENRLSNNNNRRSNFNGIRQNTRNSFNREKQKDTYHENQQNRSRFVRNDINDGSSQSRTISNNTARFNKGYRYSQAPQRQFYSDRFYNDSNEVNHYQNQRRNYGLNTRRGNYNYQEKYNYSNNYQRKPNYSEFRGKNNNKKKPEKRNEPEESLNLNQRESLIWQLSHNKYECMICVSIIRAEAPTWSCDNCYHIFHVLCIDKWAKSGDNSVVRCPACQKQFDIETSEARQKFLIYRCFCGKVSNPESRRGTTPHSCDEICGRSLVSRSSYAPQQYDVVDEQESFTSLENDGVDIEPVTTTVGGSSAIDTEFFPQDDEFVEELTESVQEELDQVNESVAFNSQRDNPELEAIASPHDEANISPEREISTVQQDLQSFECLTISTNIVTMTPLDGQVAGALIDSSEELQPHSMVILEHSSDSQWLCPHSCSLLCHPGPCPPCEALVTRACHCSRTRITTKCIVDERSLVCGSKCDRPLNCLMHRCKKKCHAGQCGSCSVRILQRCWCDAQQSRETACIARELQGTGDDTRYSCGAVCGRLLSCGKHQCVSRCHEGICEPCGDVPQDLERCWCGRVTVASLRGGCERTSCLDPRPDCGETCGRALPWCEHVCSNQCHPGQCPPCKAVVEDVHCRCGRSVLPAIECWVVTETPDSLVCSKVCGKRLACGRHQCRERCCTRYGNDEHACVLACGRTLSCQSHLCEHQCGHPGLCPTCPNVSFEELSCHCGAKTSLPPIACGQPPPTCSRDCTRPQSCDHPVRHHCHPDSELPCPPCTELTSKQCPGQHRVYHHVPCFRPVATCGLPCDQPLLSCEHRCQRLCHWGPCQPDDGDDDSIDRRCNQPCSQPRSGCGHPCAARCHSGECSPLQTPCVTLVQLHCACKVRTVTISCHRLDNTVALVKSNCSADLKRDTMELVLSPTGAVSLVCDAECRKVARNIKLVEAFDLSITSSNLNTYYSESIKKYAINNIEFLLTTEKLLLDLLKNTKNVADLQFTHTIRNISDDKIDFVNRYCSCFKMSAKPGTDKSTQKRYITIEVNRAVCNSPKPLLSELLKTESPQLFPTKPKDEKSGVENSKSTTMSFAERIRLSKKD